DHFLGNTGKDVILNRNEFDNHENFIDGLNKNTKNLSERTLMGVLYFFNKTSRNKLIDESLKNLTTNEESYVFEDYWEHAIDYTESFKKGGLDNLLSYGHATVNSEAFIE